MRDYPHGIVERKITKEIALFAAVCGALVLCLVAVLSIQMLLRPVVVNGHSMDPTYHHGEWLFTRPLKDGEIPPVGSVITFSGEDGKKLIKRVIAVPGDTIVIVDGTLYLNGEAVEDEFPAMDDPGWVYQPETVPEGRVFVLGDNRNASSDSRYFGYVYLENIFGIVTGHN